LAFTFLPELKKTTQFILTM